MIDWIEGYGAPPSFWWHMVVDGLIIFTIGWSISMLRLVAGFCGGVFNDQDEWGRKP